MKSKVLIVDDDSVMHLLYKRQIESAGCELLSAKNAVEAKKAILTHAPQIIILDIMMPGMDGLSLLRELKNSVQEMPPVIVATANLQHYTTAIQEAKASGAVTFLSKPLSPAKLVAEIQRFLPAPHAASAAPPLA